MTLEVGVSVRALLDLIAPDGSIVPIDTRGMVIGSEGQDPLVQFEDRYTAEPVTVKAKTWELLRVQGRKA